MILRLERRWVSTPAWVIIRRWNDRLDGRTFMEVAISPAGIPTRP
jgi:hypothetical protein